MKTSILIVEDDKAIQNLLSATLDANSYQCFTAETGEMCIRDSKSADHQRGSAGRGIQHGKRQI